MVHLVAKSSAAVEPWLVGTWADFREQMVSAGVSESDADARVAEYQASLFPEGRSAPGQHFLDVVDEEVVGDLWLAEQSAGQWYVYDVVVAAPFRGRGYGRLAMEAAEEYVREHGGSRLGLNVFGPNTVARQLYESLGYVTLAVGMYKDLV